MGGVRCAAVWKLVLILSAFSLSAFGQTQFNLSYDTTIPTALRASVQSATERAAAAWTRVLRDEVTVNVTIRWEINEVSQRKASGSTRYARRPYEDLVQALREDISSADDVVAFNNLPVGSIPVYLNYTADNPNGAGSATPYVDDDGDANNTFVRVPLALEKAIGLRPPEGEGEDGNILFNGALDWDFDTRDGRIEDGVFDLEVTAVHELGHILGFTSRIDSRLNLCDQRGQAAVDYDYLTPMDLFTYSAESAALNAIDWSIDERALFFSIDGGRTPGQPFATGLRLAGCAGGGDGFTRGHWQNRSASQTPIGIMDPATVAFQTITSNDLQVLDVLGWDAGAPLTEIVDSLLVDRRPLFRWRQRSGSSNYTVLGSGSLTRPFTPIAEVSGTRWLGGGQAADKARLLLVQANLPASRRPVPANKSTRLSRVKVACDSEACACLHHAVDE